MPDLYVCKINIIFILILINIQIYIYFFLLELCMGVFYLTIFYKLHYKINLYHENVSHDKQVPVQLP